MDLHDHFEAAAQRLMLGEEKLMPLGKACQFLSASRGQKASPSALCRWILHGKQGVRLDAVRLNGGGWFTSREALARFAAALSAVAAGKALEEPPASPSSLERRAKAALDRMRAEGARV